MRVHAQKAGAAPASSPPSAAPRLVHEVLRSSGQPLGPETRSFMESRFGHDFSRVRVHADGRADASARAVDALAYTVGRDVVFRQGRYDPARAEGKRLLAHELAHVAQQRHGAGPPVLQRQAATLAPQRGLGNPEATEEPWADASYPSTVALDFAPDHEFYELLAHDFAYLNELDGTSLYRAAPASPPSLDTNPAQGAMDRARLQARRHTGITPPMELKRGYAVLKGAPETGPDPDPLYYKVRFMADSDPTNEDLGLAAYTLTPVNGKGAPGILVFRGTEPALADILEDANAGGVGSRSFARRIRPIRRALTGLDQVAGSTVVTGHSLGGALAQLSAAAFPVLVGEVVTFNSPGISNAALQAFTARSAAAGPSVTHYVTQGDIVSTAGEGRLPGTTVMFYTVATRQLAALHDNDVLIAAGDGTLAQVEDVMDDLAGGRTLKAVAGAVKIMANPLGLKVLELLGELLGELHGGMHIPQSVPLGAHDTGTSTLRSAPPAEDLDVPELEKGRAALGMALFLQLDVLFTTTIPQIASDLATDGVTGGTSSAAAHVKPLLDILMSVLKKVGGLKGLIGKILYVDPVTGRMNFWFPEVEIK